MEPDAVGGVTGRMELAVLRRENPAYRIDREPRGSGYRYAATAIRLSARPWCVVTSDLGELRSALAASCCRSIGQVVGSDPPNDSPDRYPQAIADDYPGWAVTHANGRWSAGCPAVTVPADTAGELRAAIEQAITGESEG